MSATFPVGLNLEVIAKAIPAVRRQSQKFPCLVYKLKRPSATILLYQSGKCICTGVKSLGEARLAVEKLAQELRGEGVDVSEPEITIQNIVVSAELGADIDVGKIADMGIYEPERFPGVVLHLNGRTLLVFSTGRIVCVGSKSLEEAKRTIEGFVESVLA